MLPPNSQTRSTDFPTFSLRHEKLKGVMYYFRSHDPKSFGRLIDHDLLADAYLLLSLFLRRGSRKNLRVRPTSRLWVPEWPSLDPYLI